MSNCSNSANSQLKALHARLDRIDSDLIAHYAGISQLVAGLAANPFTSGSVALSLKTYNFSSVGQQLLSSLVGLIPGVSQFKTLQHLSASQLVDGLASQVESMAASVASQVANQILSAVQAQADAVLQQANAVAALAAGIAQGLSEIELAPLRAAVDTANGLLAAANSSLASVRSIADAANNFMKTLSDISNCQTRSSILKK